MNDMTPIKSVTMRTPFPDHQISKLPKATKAQNEAVKANFKAGIRCTICGGWHHPDVVHLDYVGHAALTDRLLDVDPDWNWEPFSTGPDGLPLLDRNGGLWIRLTVNGVTRPGYGDAEGKTGGNAVKEAIGDALRNAAMRFGAALDLWHKGDLHLDADGEDAGGQSQGDAVSPPQTLITDDQYALLVEMMEASNIAVAGLLKATGLAKLADLPADEFDRAKAWVKRAQDAKRAKEVA